MLASSFVNDKFGKKGGEHLFSTAFYTPATYVRWNCTQIMEKFFNSKAENYFEHFSREWWQKASESKTAMLSSARFFCAIFPIVSTCHPMTLVGAKSYLGLPPPRSRFHSVANEQWRTMGQNWKNVQKLQIFAFQKSEFLNLFEFRADL